MVFSCSTVYLFYAFQSRLTISHLRRSFLSHVGVDKIIRLVLSTEGPVSPYIHERLSRYRSEEENSRSFETPPGHTC